MLVPLFRRPVLAAALMLTIPLAGCSGPLEPTRGTSSTALAFQERNGLLAPETPSGRSEGAGDFYPLDLGNQWQYEHSFRFQLLPDGGPPEPPIVIPSTIDRELICVESRSSAQYAVEHSHQIEHSPFGTRTFDSWVRYRQDKSGLYEADVSLQEPPACEGGGPAQASRQVPDPMESGEMALRAALFAAPGLENREAYRAAWVEAQRRLEMIQQALGRALPAPPGELIGGLLPGEITRLRYPLRPGASWVIREEPLFVEAVEGIEAIDLPAGRFSAYRIRIDIPGFLGQNDRVFVWFGRSGFLKLEVHIEGEATDSNGQRIGLVISDSTEELTGLTLVSPGRF